MTYKCIKQMDLEQMQNNDEDVVSIGRIRTVPVGSLWNRDDENSLGLRLFGVPNLIRLDRIWKSKFASSTCVVEVTEELLKEYFTEVGE